VVYRVDEVNGVVGMGPGGGELVTRNSFLHRMSSAGIIQDDGSLGVEADHDHEMTIVLVGFTFEEGIGYGSYDGDAGIDPIFEFADIAQSGHVSAHSGKGPRIGGVEGPVTCPRPTGIIDARGDFGNVPVEVGAV